MNEHKNPLAALAYFIIGLVVLIAIVQILGGILRLISGVVTVVLTLALVFAIGYVVVLLVKAAYRSLQ
jgi:hypothetical protein